MNYVEIVPVQQVRIGCRNLKSRGLPFWLAMVAFVIAGNVNAKPVFTLSTRGNCPNRAELESALVSRELGLSSVTNDAEYVITSDSVGGEIVLQLRRGNGELVLSREFKSRDCFALSEAIAVVVEAYFVDMGELYEGPAPTTVLSAPPPAAPSSAPPQTTRNEERATALSKVTIHQNNQFKLRDSRPAVSARAFGGIGTTLQLPGVRLSPQLQVGLGFDFPTVPLYGEFVLASSWPTISGATPNRVWRWPSQGLLRVGLPLKGSLHYRPWTGFGVAVARLRELDLPLPRTSSRFSPLVGGGLEVAWPMGRLWLGRVDLGCSVLMIRESYRVEPDGEIGRGPRVECALVVGAAYGG